MSHQAAKISAMEMGIFVGDHVCKACALRRLRPMLDPVIKGVEKFLREL